MRRTEMSLTGQLSRHLRWLCLVLLMWLFPSVGYTQYYDYYWASKNPVNGAFHKTDTYWLTIQRPGTSQVLAPKADRSGVEFRNIAEYTSEPNPELQWCLVQVGNSDEIQGQRHPIYALYNRAVGTVKVLTTEDMPRSSWGGNPEAPGQFMNPTTFANRITRYGHMITTYRGEPETVISLSLYYVDDQGWPTVGTLSHVPNYNQAGDKFDLTPYGLEECNAIRTRSLIHSLNMVGGTTSISTTQGNLATAYNSYKTDKRYALTVERILTLVPSPSGAPTANKYYRIQSGHYGFYENGQKRSVLSASSNTTFGWGARVEREARQIWKLTGSANNWYLENLATGQKISGAGTTTSAGAAIKIQAIDCAPGHFMLTAGTQVLHASGHNGGTATSGSIIDYHNAGAWTMSPYHFRNPNTPAQALDAASAWMLEEVPQSLVDELDIPALTMQEEAEAKSWLAPIGVVHGFTTSNQPYSDLLTAWVNYSANKANRQLHRTVRERMSALKTYYDQTSTAKVPFSLEGVYYIRNGVFSDFTYSTTNERGRLLRHANNTFSWTLLSRAIPAINIAPTEWANRPLNEKWLIRQNPENQSQYSIFNLESKKYIGSLWSAPGDEVWLTLEQVKNAFFAIKAGGHTFHAGGWSNNTDGATGNAVNYTKDSGANSDHFFQNGTHTIASPSTWFLEPASLPALSDQEKAQIMAFLANTRVVHGFVDPTATAELRRRYTTVMASGWSTQPLAKRSADLYRLRQEMERIKEKYDTEKTDPAKVVQWDPNKVYRLRNGGVERWADAQKYYAFVNDANVPKAHLASEEITGTASDRDLWIIVASDANGTHTFMNVATGRYLSTATTTSFDAVDLNTQLYRDEDYPGYYRIKTAGQSAPLHALQRNQEEIGLGNWGADNNEKDLHGGDPARLNSGSTWLFEPQSMVSALSAVEISEAQAFIGSVGVVKGFRTSNAEVQTLAAAYSEWSQDKSNAFKRARVRAYLARTKELYRTYQTNDESANKTEDKILDYIDGGIYTLRSGSLNALVASPQVERVIAHLPNQIVWQRLTGEPTAEQKWIVRRKSGTQNQYSFRNVHTGKYLSGPGSVSETQTWIRLDSIGAAAPNESYPAFYDLVTEGGQHFHTNQWPNLSTTSESLSNYQKDGNDARNVHLYANGQLALISSSSWQLKPATVPELTDAMYRKAKLYAWAEGIVGGFYSCDVAELRSLLGLSATNHNPIARANLSNEAKALIPSALDRLSVATRIPFVSGGYYYIRSMKEGFLEQGIRAMMYEHQSQTPAEGRRPRWKKVTAPQTDATVVWRITGGIGGSQHVQIANFSSGTYLVGLSPTPMFPTDQGYCQVLYINPTEAPGRVRLFLGRTADSRKPHPNGHSAGTEGDLTPWNNTASGDPDKYNNSDEVRGLTNESITESVSAWALVPIDIKTCATDQEQQAILPVLTEEMKIHVRDYLASEGFVRGYTTAQLAGLKQAFRDGNGDARTTFEALMAVKTQTQIAFDPTKFYRLHRASRTASNRNQVMYVDYKLTDTQTTPRNQPKVHVSDPSLVSELWRISALNTPNANIKNPNVGNNLALSGKAAMSAAGSGTFKELNSRIHPGMIYLNFGTSLAFVNVDAEMALVSASSTFTAGDIYAYSEGVGHNSYFFTDRAVWYLKEVTQIELKTADRKMVSLCYPFAVSLHRMPDTNANGNLWLYRAAEDSRSQLKIEAQSGQSIPANTPAFIEQADPQNSLTLDIVYGQQPAAWSVPSSVQGVLAPAPIAKGNYVLKNTMENGVRTAKLYLTERAGYTNPNKVYLRPWAPNVTPATRSISRAFAETTSIDEIEILDAPEPGEIYYDISGVRVFHPQGGIFVTARGRKVYIR